MKRDRLKCLSISHIDIFLAIGYTIIVGLYDKLISMLAYIFFSVSSTNSHEGGYLCKSSGPKSVDGPCKRPTESGLG